MTREEAEDAIALAHEVESGKCRSYVDAARTFARYILAGEKRRLAREAAKRVADSRQAKLFDHFEID